LKLVSSSISNSDQSKELLEKSLYPTLVKGLTELCKNKPPQPAVSIV
jgi:hypothetical protein